MSNVKYPLFVKHYMEMTGRSKGAAFHTLRNGHHNGLFESGAVILVKQRPDAKRGRYLCNPEKFKEWLENRCAVKA